MNTKGNKSVTVSLTEVTSDWPKESDGTVKAQPQQGFPFPHNSGVMTY